jgi:arginase
VSLLGGQQHFQADDVVQVGCRDDDDAMDEAGALLAVVVPASHVVNNGVPAVIDPIVTTVVRPELDGYWIHVDVDVLDESVMRAVDSPSPGGLSPGELIDLLQALAPSAAGAHVGIYDPDLDPDGTAAQVVVDCVVEGLAGIGSEALAR